jgi:G protein-coupled receptor GPR1
MRRSTSQPLNLSPLLADTFETSGWLSSHAKLQISYQSDVAQHVNTLSENANLIIRIIAIVSSSLSVLTGLVAIYFFHRMEKRYRHKYHSNGTIYVFFNTDLIPARLIVFNISGDILRALWYLIFCSASLAGYDAPDHSALCQMTGYFLSVGYEVTGMTIAWESNWSI